MFVDWGYFSPPSFNSGFEGCCIGLILTRSSRWNVYIHTFLNSGYTGTLSTVLKKKRRFLQGYLTLHQYTIHHHWLPSGNFVVCYGKSPSKINLYHICSQVNENSSAMFASCQVPSASSSRETFGLLAIDPPGHDFAATQSHWHCALMVFWTARRGCSVQRTWDEPGIDMKWNILIVDYSRW